MQITCVWSRFGLIYPTGQKYSLGLMFAKFATAKIAKDLNPLKITSTRLCNLANNTKGSNMMLNDYPDWDSNPGPLGYWSVALPTELHRLMGT